MTTWTRKKENEAVLCSWQQEGLQLVLVDAARGEEDSSKQRHSNNNTAAAETQRNQQQQHQREEEDRADEDRTKSKES